MPLALERQVVRTCIAGSDRGAAELITDNNKPDAKPERRSTLRDGGCRLNMKETGDDRRRKE